VLVAWKYRPRDTFVQRLDPRTRLIFMFSVIMAITVGQIWDIRFILPISALVLAYYLSARIEWRDVRRAWMFIFILVVVIIGLNALISGRGGPAEVLDDSSPVLFQTPLWIVPLVNWKIQITISTARAFFAITQITRMLTMSALAIPIPYTMDPSVYGVAFRQMGLPDKAAVSMDLAFRFVPTLGRDFSITMDAQRARGYELESMKGGIFDRLRKTAPLLIPVTMQSVVTGEEVIDAMDLRAFGVRPRTWLKTLKFGTLDYAMIGLGLLLVATAITLSILGYADFWVPEWWLNMGRG
jgi:energy-coupling factor transport system permease protein